MLDPGKRMMRCGALRGRILAVFEPLEFVLARVGPGLHFDQGERLVFGCGQGVCRAGRNRDGFAWPKVTCCPVESNLGGAVDNHPVLGGVTVTT